MFAFTCNNPVFKKKRLLYIYLGDILGVILVIIYLKLTGL